MSVIEDLEKRVLALPLAQRVQLTESLLGSLPSSEADWSEAEELAEVERREREIEQGTAQPISEAEMWRRVESARRR